MTTTMTVVEAKRLDQILGSIKMAEAMMAKNARTAALTKAQTLAKLQELDAKGDKAKAEGNVEKAKFYYGYALRIASKAGI
jgi:hypothetical protein